MIDLRLSRIDSVPPCFDLVVCAIGYEARASFAAESRALRGRVQLAYAFEDRHVLSFDENLEWFRNAGFDCQVASDDEFRASLADALSQMVGRTALLSIALDISSFNRVRLASAMHLCRQLALDGHACKLHFYYSLAQFTQPSSVPSTNTHVGPVIPEFAGWTDDPMLPPHAVLGLGYEQGKALGALDHLEIADAIAFIPESPVEDYYPAVLKANEDLLATIGTDHSVRYNVHDPIQAFGLIESTVDGIRRTCNPILLPFGPKLFFVNSLLVALVHPECSVWRVSAGESESAVDRRPSGQVVSFAATLVNSSALDALPSTPEGNVSRA